MPPRQPQQSSVQRPWSMPLEGAGLLMSPLASCIAPLLIGVEAAQANTIGLATARWATAIRSTKPRRNRFTAIAADK